MPVVPFARQSNPTAPQGDVPSQTDLAIAAVHLMSEREAATSDTLESVVRKYGETRFNTQGTTPEDRKFLNHLPDDIEREDLNEFGANHPNNTTKLRLKSAGIPTS
jgi:hypothetical protein